MTGESTDPRQDDPLLWWWTGKRWHSIRRGVPARFLCGARIRVTEDMMRAPHPMGGYNDPTVCSRCRSIRRALREAGS